MFDFAHETLVHFDFANETLVHFDFALFPRQPFKSLLSSHSSGRIVTILLIVPPAWVDLSWELVQVRRNNII
jgi:hypothetical protein